VPNIIRHWENANQNHHEIITSTCENTVIKNVGEDMERSETLDTGARNVD
jgi:hypothetical protein